MTGLLFRLPLAAGTRDALTAYVEADAALAANSADDRAAGIHQETSRFLSLNRAAWQARAGLPWWLRFLVD